MRMHVHMHTHERACGCACAWAPKPPPPICDRLESRPRTMSPMFTKRRGRSAVPTLEGSVEKVKVSLQPADASPTR